MRILKQIGVTLALCFTAIVLNAQNIEYGVVVDTNYMLIGDQQHLTFRVKTVPGIRILFPQLKDTVVSGVEIISGPSRDSVKEADGNWLFEEKYVITVFDTGVYVIPPMPITIEGQEYNNVLRTDPIAFVVNTYQVDPQKGNYDIVMPYETPWTFVEILPYLLWTLLGLAVVALAGWLWWRHKKNRPLFAPKKEEIPPYEKAIRSLDGIKGEKLWQAGLEKEYYTRLTDTIRQYLDEELDIPAMERTSMEILKSLSSCPKVESAEREKLEQMLTTADFVKFAKYTPLQDENACYLDTAYGFVQVVHQRVQAEKDELQKQAEETRRREEEAVKADMKTESR